MQNKVYICVKKKKKIFGSFLCNVATLALNDATFQRRDVSTSRRLFEPSLSRRDVDFHNSLSRRDVDFQRRDVDFHNSLSRRDMDFQRRDVDFHNPLERRDVVSNVATWILMGLCHVATLLLNVATLLIPLSVTSRRCPERRDVV